MTTQLLQSYSEAKQRARNVICNFNTDKEKLLPTELDESWRKVDLQSVDWPAISMCKEAFDANQQIVATEIDGAFAEPSADEKENLLAKLAALSDLEPDLPAPELSRDTPESFLRRNIFSLLNLAISTPVVLVAKDTTDSDRITIRHKASATNRTRIFAPATVIRVPAGVNTTIIEDYLEDESSIRTGNTLILVEENAKLNYLQLRKDGQSAHFHHVRFLVERDAVVDAGLLQFGGSTGKSFFQASMIGQGGEFHGRALFSGKDAQVFQLEMGVQHLANHTNSNLIYKCVANDRSHSVFLGNLEVPFGVQKVHSYQVNHNLILDSKARTESRPWLVIRAEDVACDHGATVGDLDEEAVFFLLSRGLPLEEARRLLIEGFFEEVLDLMPLNDTEKEDARLRIF